MIGRTRYCALLLVSSIGCAFGAPRPGDVAPEPIAPAPRPITTPSPIEAPGPIDPRRVLVPVAAPAPTGIVVAGTPLVAYLSWNAVPDAQRYAVIRLDGVNPPLEVTPAGFTGTQFQDVVPDPRLTYGYVIAAYYANGTSGQAQPVQYISPPMINPPGFTARDGGNAGVVFQWQAVPGAIRYRLDGPGLPNTGYFVRNTNTSAGHPNIPAGPGSWRLVALYPGNYADYPGASIASTVIRLLPPHSQPWLSKPNGAGQLSQVQTPAHQELNNSPGAGPIGNLSGDLFPVYGSAYAAWLGQTYYWGGWCMGCTIGLAFRTSYDSDYGDDSACADIDTPVLGCSMLGLKLWLHTTSVLWDDVGHTANEAVYGNPGDLGVGRRAYCEQKMRGPPVPGMYTICYATAHGAQPGQPGFNDAAAITHPGETLGGQVISEGISSDFILAMVIVKDASGTEFFAFGKNGKYPLLPSVQLDTEGPKLVPFVCTSCHGGRYNQATRKVDGASFLPLDPELLAFASPADQAQEEEKIRKINLMIHNSDPNSPIGAYIRGLYNGAPGQPGARAQPDFVPAGWAPQAGFYRQVVRPYCTMCHLAQPNSSYSFASWGNFQGYAPLIRASVCGAHTMPHNELQFKAFWLKDTGSLYVPGLLAATLGLPSCP